MKQKETRFKEVLYLFQQDDSCFSNYRRMFAEMMDQMDELRNSITRASTTSTFARQLPVSNEIKVFLCDGCGKNFFAKERLRVHIQKNYNPTNQRFECGLGMDLSKNRGKKIRKSPKANGFKCKICNTVLKWKKSLQRHMTRIHNGERLFACKICGKIFTEKRALTNHERIHNGERPFACKICGKTFAYYSNLSRHKRTHNGERPFACKICGKTFTEKRASTNHERIHNGERPFACKICGKTFAHYSNLSRHKRIHNGERPFACKICGNTFTQSSHLSSHKRIHNGERPYTCATCEKTFRRKVSLKNHIEIHMNGFKLFKDKTRPKSPHPMNLSKKGSTSA